MKTIDVTREILFCERSSIRDAAFASDRIPKKDLGGHFRVIHRGNSPGMGMTSRDSPRKGQRGSFA